MSTQSEVHNQIVPEVVSRIVRGALESGGDGRTALVMLESVICGVMCAVVDPAHDSEGLGLIHSSVERRLAEMRLAGMKVEGQA